MNEWLEKTRNRPDSAKNKIAIIFAASVTLLIAGIWLLVIREKNVDQTVRADSTREDLKPLFMIFKSAKDDFKQIKSDIKSQKANAVDGPSSDSAVVE